MSRAELVLYATEDGAALFQSTTQNITQHVSAIYADSELSEKATCKHDLQVRSEGGRQVRRTVKRYNLDMILAIGYRVKSARGTQFRQWATTHLKEYLVKGSVLDDKRLKGGASGDYFGANELDQLNRIVSMLLDFAKLRAMRRKNLRMSDWRTYVDSFMDFNERRVLQGNGRMSHEDMTGIAHERYEQFDATRRSVEAQQADRLALRELEQWEVQLNRVHKSAEEGKDAA